VAVGGEDIICDVWCRDLLDVGHLRPYRLQLEVKGEELDLKPNTLATRWENLDSLVAIGRMGAFISGSKEVVMGEFWKELGADKATDNAVGGVIRWTIQVDGTTKLRLYTH
jgi:hypothetical protein